MIKEGMVPANGDGTGNLSNGLIVTCDHAGCKTEVGYPIRAQNPQLAQIKLVGGLRVAGWKIAADKQICPEHGR